jgi:hypothetical protein
LDYSKINSFEKKGLGTGISPSSLKVFKPTVSKQDLYQMSCISAMTSHFSARRSSMA